MRLGWRVLPAAVAIVVMALAVLGIGQGRSEYQGQPAPGAAQVAQSRRQIAASPDAVAGTRVFEQAGCNRCHALAAIGADGALGPRLDAVGDNAEGNAQYIASSRRDGDNIMPRDYGTRLGATRLREVAELVHAAYVGRG